MKTRTNNTIAGIQPVKEAILSGAEIDRAYIREGKLSDTLKDLLYELRALKVPTFRVPLAKLNQLTKSLHQGIVIFRPLISYTSLDFVISESYRKGKMPLILLLEDITDVRNLGALARTAECAGVDALVLKSKGSALVNDIAIKTSAGALNILSICRVTSLVSTIGYLKKSGLQVLGTALKPKANLYKQDFKKPLALIMGSEGQGLSEETIKLCDSQVCIPHFGQVKSLNVSVAAGVILFECMRQRSIKEK